MKNVLLFFLWVPSLLHSQIVVDKAGDGWDEEVNKTLHYVYGISPKHYQQIVDFVNRVEFWNESYSSNNGRGQTIVIAANDMKLKSINNIAAILIHESCHIRYSYVGRNGLSEAEEEQSCYIEELAFLKMLPNVEKELIEHAEQQIKNYNKK